MSRSRICICHFLLRPQRCHCLLQYRCLVQDPCGPPPTRENRDDCWPLKFTDICLFSRNFIITLTRDHFSPILISFVTVLVASVLEKAEGQSKAALTTARIPGFSNKLRTLSTSLTTRCSVPIPFLPANLFLSMLAPISSVTLPLRNSSKIYEKSRVEATFLTSSHVFSSLPSLGFGTGVHHSRRHIAGYVPSLRQELIISVRGSDRSTAHSIRSLSGISIGNVDLVFPRVLIMCMT